MMFWQGFKDWMYQAWLAHPLYTLCLGGGCFVLGYWLG